MLGACVCLCVCVRLSAAPPLQTPRSHPAAKVMHCIQCYLVLIKYLVFTFLLSSLYFYRVYAVDLTLIVFCSCHVRCCLKFMRFGIDHSSDIAKLLVCCISYLKNNENIIFRAIGDKQCVKYHCPIPAPQNAQLLGQKYWIETSQVGD